MAHLGSRASVGRVNQWIVLSLAAVAVLASAPQKLHADMTGARQEAFALAGQLMSPFCPGLLLSDCQSQGAHDLKDEIKKRLEAGETREAVVSDLVRRFGPAIRGAPELKGVGLLAWFGPAVIGGLGVVVLSIALKRFTRHTAPQNGNETPFPDASPELSARVERELDALD